MKKIIVLYVLLSVFLLSNSILLSQRQYRDLEYAKVDDISLFLDLYTPQPPSDNMPLVVWIHGGGWQAGNRAPCPAHALGLLDRGYTVASISYRLTDKAIFPAQINDCKAAIRWLRANAEKYNINPDRIGVWGSSAGGHLSALLGVSNGEEKLEGDIGENLSFSSDVNAVCDWYGPTDLTLYIDSEADHARSMIGKLLGGSISDSLEKAKDASPVYWVDATDAPFLIMQGTNDPLVPTYQSFLLDSVLKAINVESELVILEGAGHGDAPFRTDEILNKIYDFFDRHIKFTSGVDEIYPDLEINIYPNPATDHIFIKSEISEYDFFSIKILNVLGNVVYKEDSIVDFEDLHKVNLKNFVKGIYTVSLTGNDVFFSKAILISN